MSTRTYLVSGAGSGIGRAIALQIAQSSPENKLILLGRNLERLEAVREALPRASHHRVVQADVSDPRGLAQAIAKAQLEKENLACVVANAGVGGANDYGPGDRWNEVIGTNLSGTYHLVMECLPALRASTEKYRHIVVISSVLARLGVPKYSAYCASKAGLLGLTRSWAVEFAREKILVNAICPGWVETDMAESGVKAIAAATRRTYEEALSLEMARVPTGKMSTPDEVAALVDFLVSGRQTSITGQALDINGGSVMA